MAWRHRSGAGVAGPGGDAARGWSAIWRGPGLAVALAVVCYVPSLGNGFAYDDIPLIVENERIRGAADWRALWLTDWWEGDGGAGRDRLYRPLVLQTFALNYALHGLDPFGYHLVNVLLHGAATWLAWLVTRRLCGSAGSAAVVAVLFAVHPVHVEAVANVVGRADVLAAVFVLAGLAALLPRGGGVLRWERCGAAGAAFLGALLCKESAVAYPAVAGLVLVWRRMVGGAATGRVSWVGIVVLLSPLAVYFALRAAALEGDLLRGEATSVLFNPLVGAGAVERVVGALTVFGHYVRLLVFPATLSSDYGYAVIDPAAGMGALGIVGALGLVAVGAGLGQWRSRSGEGRLIALSTAMFVASYALLSNTALLIGVTVAERLMYFPSYPALLAMALGARAGWRAWLARGEGAAGAAAVSAQRRRWVGMVVAVVVVACAGRTAVRSTAWASNEALFLEDVARFPESAHLSQAAGEVLLGQVRRGEAGAETLEAAETHLRRAVGIHPRFPVAVRQLGVVHALRGERERAVARFQAALQMNPTDTLAQQWLAALGGAGGLRERVAELEAVIAARPAELEPRLELVEALNGLGERAAALAAARAAAERFPEEREALRALAEMLVRMEALGEAEEVARQWVAVAPEDWRGLTLLAGLLAAEDAEAALGYARRAYELAPGEVRPAVNLAEVLALLGRRAEAAALLRGVLERLPRDHALRGALERRLQELE